ncbi:MAG TPA: rhodanese-like domain-containing protein [Terriglobia bacterium]|nr:rhodanese-like domain-containing protein [Terriglobia bacterium]
MRILATCIVVLTTAFLTFGVQRPQPNPVGKWQPSELIRPQELIVKVRDNGPSKPLIIFTGFMPLYRNGHIPGAVFGGPTSSAAGLEALKRAVEKVPKNREIVIYCGCCPWEACPNVRPAIELLHQLGYQQVKGLVVSSNLEADWTSKGYPLDKGE